MAVSGLVLTASVVPARASNISSLQAQASALSNQIQALGLRAAGLSEQYDAASLALQQAEARVTAARKALETASARTARARSVLQSAAVNAYLNAGGSAEATTSSPISSADEGLLRTEYETSLADTQAAAVNQYRTASLEDATAEGLLRQAETAARDHVAGLASARSQVLTTQGQLQSLLSSDTGRIAQLVAAQQAQQRAAEQRQAEAAARQRAAQQAAAATTTTPAAAPTTVQAAPGGGAPQPGFTPPASSSAAQVAVAAAESRVGDPYVWGAAGPGSFDCSGLVMWAYEQAGISLPHYSGAQYADTVHIPMSDLQPGDLVFFSDPGEHVAMYVGNGDVVQAPYPGANVQVVPMYSAFTLAARVQ